MRLIPARLRRLVPHRSGERCEYRRLSQAGQEATFHIDHVIPVAVGGRTVAGNLALACVSCSLRKGARQTAVDPQAKLEVPLFNPRRDVWSEHFEWRGVRLAGLTATGRATIKALALNRPLILAIRREEAELGRHPLSITAPARPGARIPESRPKHLRLTHAAGATRLQPTAA